MAIELVSFDDLKIYLGIIKTEGDYPELSLIQESVVGMFEEYTGRIFKLESHTQKKVIFCDRTRMVKLDAIPIADVSSVSVNGISTADYKIRPYGIELGFWIEDAVVEVVYSGGISKVSDSLKRAALLQTVYEFQNKDSVGIQTVSTDGGTVTKPELGMLKEVMKLLERSIHPYPVF